MSPMLNVIPIGLKPSIYSRNIFSQQGDYSETHFSQISKIIIDDMTGLTST
jgi:hypothetical protein